MSEQIDLTDYADSDSKEDSEWVEKRLGEIFESIYSGGTPKKGVDEYYGGDLPFVKIEDLNEQQGSGVTTAENYITEQALEETSTRVFDSGTLLMTIYGSLAETALVQSRVATNQGILGLWNADDDNVLYVRYAIDNSQPKLASLSRQTTQANLGKGIVKKHKIQIPPLPEQRKIATVLYTIDRAIEKTEKIRERTERVRAGTAQDLFRHGISQQETKETWLGEIPENWDVVQFSEIVDSNRNGLYKSTDAYGEGCPIAKMGNALEKRTLDMSSADRLELTDKEKEKYGLKKGDLIFARRAQEVSAAGDCCYVPQLDELTVFESSLIRVRLSEGANPRFYTQYFDSPVGSRSIERIVTETSISGIATSDLLDLKIAVPSPDEQNEIASIMWQFDRQEKVLQREKEQYERLKRGLMQDLLSGTIRTTDTNIEVPEEIAQYG